MYFRVSSHLSMWTWSTTACYHTGFATVFFQFRFFPIQCKLKINCHSILISCVIQNLTKYRCRIRKKKRKSSATRPIRPIRLKMPPYGPPMALISTTPWTTKMQNTDAIIPMVAVKRNCFLIDIYSYESYVMTLLKFQIETFNALYLSILDTCAFLYFHPFSENETTYCSSCEGSNSIDYLIVTANCKISKIQADYSLYSSLTAIIFLNYRVASKMALEILGYTMCRLHCRVRL